MGYVVLLHPKASRALEDLEKTVGEWIRKKLRELSSKPEKGERLKHSDFWRLRIGEYRAIYEIDYKNQKVIVLFIGHRKEVYDDFSRLL